jgi:hypothetical protein
MNGPKHILARAGQKEGGMPTYSIAKAKDNLSKLVDAARIGGADCETGEIAPEPGRNAVDIIRRMRGDYP